VAFKSVVIPWLSGGLIVVGYAAINWLRAKQSRSEHGLSPKREPTRLLSASLEHIPDGLVVESDEELPANSNAFARSADLGALFLGRANEALSPLQFMPEWPDERR